MMTDHELELKIDRVSKAPPSFPRDEELTWLKWEQEDRQLARRREILAIARRLFKSYMKSRSMIVWLPDGHQLQWSYLNERSTLSEVMLARDAAERLATLHVEAISGPLRPYR